MISPCKEVWIQTAALELGIEPPWQSFEEFFALAAVIDTIEALRSSLVETGAMAHAEADAPLTVDGVRARRCHGREPTTRPQTAMATRAVRVRDGEVPHAGAAPLLAA